VTMNVAIIEGGFFLPFFFLFLFSGTSDLPSLFSFSSSFSYYSLLLGF
jgi:hypothetical protein